MKVYVKDGNFEGALRKFKKKVEDSGILVEYVDRMEYEKPTTARKRKAAAAKSRWKKKLREQQMPKIPH